MKHPLFAASVLSTAVGLALAAQAPSVRAQGANPPQIERGRQPPEPWSSPSLATREG